MPSCSGNDVRWSHGQPFTFILDLSDNAYDPNTFFDAEMVYQVSDGTAMHQTVWRLIKSIVNSPSQGFVTVILQASDPGLSTSGQNIDANKRGAAAGPPLRDSVSGPVATFVTPDGVKKGARAASGSSSSASSSSSTGPVSGVTVLNTTRVSFQLKNAPSKI
jgi:hypothetical protein